MAGEGPTAARTPNTANTDLKHVCVGVVGVFHNDRVTPGQCVGDAVLALVAECLPTGKTDMWCHMTRRAGGHFQRVAIHDEQGSIGALADQMDTTTTINTNTTNTTTPTIK